MNKLTIFLIGLSCFLAGYILGGLLGGKGGFKPIIGSGNKIYRGCTNAPEKDDEDDDSFEDEKELRKLDGIEDNLENKEEF